MRRVFTPEQKFEILKDIERCETVKEGLAKHQLQYSVSRKWRRQLEVGVRATLRNSRPLKSEMMLEKWVQVAPVIWFSVPAAIDCSKIRRLSGEHRLGDLGCYRTLFFPGSLPQKVRNAFAGALCGWE